MSELPVSRRLLNITKAMLDDAEKECERLRASNVALLEMLKFAAAIIGHPDDEGSKLIAAAIAEEGKHD